MAKILTIEELAKHAEIDTSEYGTKAEGLAILHNYMNELRNKPDNKDTSRENHLRTQKEELSNADSENLKEYLEIEIEGLEEWKEDESGLIEKNFEVDPAFVVPKSIDLGDNPKLKERYIQLVSTETKFMKRHSFHSEGSSISKSPLRIVMARSTDENEMPGKFETHFSLYDPNDIEASFKRWLEASRKVRESGAGGVIGQVLVATGEYPTPRSKDYRLKAALEDGKIPNEVIFGLRNCSFVGNTGGVYGSETHTIAAVVGLPSKIARGDTDFSLIMQNVSHSGIPHTFYHTKHDYQRDIHAVAGGTDSGGFPQETMDIITADTPEKTKTIDFIDGTVRLGTDPYWGTYAFPSDCMRISDLLNILNSLKERTGKHIEIEGTFRNREHFPHIFQLRKYDLPETRLKELSDVDPNKVLQGRSDAYVADRFSGDLVVLTGEDKIDESGLRSKLGNCDYILMTPPDKMPYEDSVGIDLRNFRDMKGLVIPIFWQHTSLNPGMHTIGYMLGVLTKIQKETPVIALQHDQHNLCGDTAIEKFGVKIEVYDGFSIIRGATVESDGKKGQIYINK